MGCMKCGKKLGKSETFCDECLERMALAPVSANVVVKLPDRKPPQVTKKKRNYYRYFWNAEGEIDTLRSKIRWLRFALIVAILGFLVAVGFLFMILYMQGHLDGALKMLPV